MGSGKSTVRHAPWFLPALEAETLPPWKPPDVPLVYLFDPHHDHPTLVVPNPQSAIRNPKYLAIRRPPSYPFPHAPHPQRLTIGAPQHENYQWHLGFHNAPEKHP